MALHVRFEFYGDVQLDRTIADTRDRVQDLRPVWEVLAGRFAIVEGRQFATEGRYGSGGWAPLSERYGAWKARHYPGKPILQREGDLIASLTRRPFGIEVIETDRAIFGSDVEYGLHHQRGGTVDGRPPQRRPVELPERERVEWIRLIQRYVVTGTLGGARATNLRPS